MFEQSLVLPTPTNNRWTFAASLTMQAGAIGVLLLLPLIYTEQLAQVLNRGSISMPTPPMPQPPVHAVPEQMQPRVRATRIADPFQLVRTRPLRPLIEIMDGIDPAPSMTVCTNCVPGAVGVTGSVPFLGNDTHPAPPPAPPTAVVERKPEPVKQVLQIGGDVQAAKIIRRVIPVYPALAKQARISGTVKLMSRISRDGTVEQLEVVSGHPLLVKAALEAVRQWVYRPTLLNGNPVEVVAPIDVNFTLSN